MAGMLAGVESARRRRIHQNIVCSSSPSPTTAGASLSLRHSLFFPTSSPSSPSTLGRSRTNKGQVDDKLGQLARQAKERLDERLSAQSKSKSKSKSLPTRNINTGEARIENRNINTSSSSNINSIGSKKKKKGWGASAMARLGGGMKSQEIKGDSDCVICLQELRTSSSSSSEEEEEEEVVNLECSHTFHMNCITPWLHSHPICPCCRTPISSSFFSSS